MYFMLALRMHACMKLWRPGVYVYLDTGRSWSELAGPWHVRSRHSSQVSTLQSKAPSTMSVHASNGTCELLARVALCPVHQLSLRLLTAAGHLESPWAIAEVRLGRSLNLLPGCQRDEAHLQQDTCSPGFAINLPMPCACCKACGQNSGTRHLGICPTWLSM